MWVSLKRGNSLFTVSYKTEISGAKNAEKYVIRSTKNTLSC
ncbi:hypothetical protein PROVRETT_08834 [Providencia rettgeri DSM 1131]|nr:hypothetical protein PROVRETT_08834 [Providencia rettgeri DSM 1131]